MAIDPNWHKSSYSGGEGGACIEVAENVLGATMFRDTKIENSPIITVEDSTWGMFLTLIK
ncbi:DUF397 domain-containing protein [Streptomyces sp. NPDC021093]|uniref:DUF397 domain-containing protein n=1 Tax=Streptomyces sp. NPDC021093 TaxID=3365112 RepID=UPI0037914494